MNLDKLLRPRSLVVIGASEKGMGGDTCRNMLEYTRDLDKVYFVNPKRETVFSRPCYKSILDIPVTIDLAVLCTPQAAVDGIMQDLIAKKCSAVLIFASGYGETGPEGKKAQDELAALCQEHGIAMMGPNCAGFANYVDDVFSFAFLSEKRDRHGDIGLISQSGQICLAALDTPHLNFSYLISSGNSATVSIEEYLLYLVEDDNTKVVAAFIEGITKPAVLIRALERAAAKKKPVVILKSGRSQRASQIAASHTGSLAGTDSAIDAVFKRYGVIRVDDVQELFGAAKLFSVLSTLPTSSQVAALNVSGGEAGIAADMGMLYQVEYSDISTATRDGLKAMLPSYATPNNPMDMTGTIAYDPDRLCKGIELFMAEPDVGAVLIDYTITPDIYDDTIPCLIEGIQKAKAHPWCTKPILWVPFVEHTRHAKSVETLTRLGVPLLPSGIYAFKLIAKLMDFAVFCRKKSQPQISLPSIPPAQTRVAYSEYDSKQLLQQSGFSLPPMAVARSTKEVERAAEPLGYPLVMKINSPDILHKSDVGGVILNLTTPQEAIDAYVHMMQHLAKNCPTAHLDGVLMQRMMPAGVECIIGVKNDPQFGPMIMVGLGGVFVEVFKDVQLAPAPLSKTEALAMLQKLRGYKLLAGYRGTTKKDVDALAELMVRVSQFAAQKKDTLLELDLNPVFVYPEGEGVGIVDALVIATQ